MPFLENFLSICEARGETPSHALKSAGLAKSLLSKWRSSPDRVPYGDTVKKLADYFGCSFEDLMYSGPVKSRTETALKIQAAVDQMDEERQRYLLRFIQFMMENRE